MGGGYPPGHKVAGDKLEMVDDILADNESCLTRRRQRQHEASSVRVGNEMKY